MKGDSRNPSRATMRQQTRGLVATMSDAELANCALMNAQNLELDPAIRQSINLELREEIARRKAAQEEGVTCERVA